MSAEIIPIDMPVATKFDETTEDRCSFCYATKSEANFLVRGPGANICPACVGSFRGILARNQYPRGEA